MAKVKVDVDHQEASMNMRTMFHRARDFKSVFRWAQRELEKANRANFATNGIASGKPWMPLDNEYARWKLQHRGGRPMLVVSGTLRDSLTRLRGAPNEIDKKQAWFGTNVTTHDGRNKPLARYHQSGTSKMPARKIVFVPPLFALALAERTAKHIVYGGAGVRGAAGIASGATRLLKGTF